MPTDKHGNYRHNFQSAMMHDASTSGEEKPRTSDMQEEPAHSVHIYRKSDGGYHTSVQHSTGDVEHGDHEDLQSAHDHSSTAFMEHDEPDGHEGMEESTTEGARY